MKFEFEHEIQVPFEEKTFILPQPRIKLFQNLIENYKVFCPELKLIYAFLNFNSNYNDSVLKSENCILLHDNTANFQPEFHLIF